MSMRLFSTLSFSTVMPAVFGTAELVGTWGRLKRIGPGPVIRPTPAVLRGMFAAGGLMLLLLLAWPDRLLSPRLVFRLLHHRTAECETGKPLAPRRPRPGRLAAGHRPLHRLPHLRLLLGDVELLLLSEVGLPDPLRRRSSPLRDAACGLSRLPPLFLELFALYQLVTGFFTGGKARNHIHLAEV